MCPGWWGGHRGASGVTIMGMAWLSTVGTAPPVADGGCLGPFQRASGAQWWGTRHVGVMGAAHSPVPLHCPPALLACTPLHWCPQTRGEAAGGPSKNVLRDIWPWRGGWAQGCPQVRGDWGDTSEGLDLGLGVPDPRSGGVPGPQPLRADPAWCCHHCPWHQADHPGVLWDLPSLGDIGDLYPV